MPGGPEHLSPAEVETLVLGIETWLPYIAVGIPVFAMAFTRAVRRIIGNRDGWQSVQSGDGGPLEAAHISHDKKNPNYNDPSNGRMLTPAEHYDDHYNRHGKDQLGLNNHQNKWSLRMIWGRLSDKDKEGRNPPDSV